MKASILKGTAALALVSAMFAATVYAEETAAPVQAPLMTLSRTGAVAITLPTDDWKEVAMDEACVTFSDGQSIISFDHYKIDENVQVPTVAAGSTGCYYMTIDIQNDNKLVFGAYTESAAVMDAIKESIAKAKVYVDKLPQEEKHEIVVDNYSIEACDYMAYVTADELYVRPEGGQSGAPLGSLYRGEEVHVTGKVMLNGAADGWVRIDYKGGNGYVSTDFLSDNKPQPETSSNPTFEDISDKISYYDYKYLADGNMVKVVVLNDGRTLDMNGNEVVGFADGAMKMVDGTVLYDFNPTVQTLDDWLINGTQDVVNPQETTAAGDLILYNDAGESTLIHPEGGSYFDYNGNEFWQNEGGVWFNLSDHSEWY